MAEKVLLLLFLRAIQGFMYVSLVALLASSILPGEAASSSYCLYHPEDTEVCGENTFGPAPVPSTNQHTSTVSVPKDEDLMPDKRSIAQDYSDTRKWEEPGTLLSPENTTLPAILAAIALISVSSLLVWYRFLSITSSSTATTLDSSIMSKETEEGDEERKEKEGEVEGSEEEGMKECTSQENDEGEGEVEQTMGTNKEKEKDTTEGTEGEDDIMESFELVRNEDESNKEDDAEGGVQDDDVRAKESRQLNNSNHNKELSAIVGYIKQGLEVVDVDINQLSSGEKTTLVVKAVELGIKHRSYRERNHAHKASSSVQLAKLQERKRAHSEKTAETMRANKQREIIAAERLRIQRTQQREEMREKNFAFLSKLSLALMVGAWLMLIHWKIGLWRLMDRLTAPDSNWLFQFLQGYQGSSYMGWAVSTLLSYVISPVFYVLVFIAFGLFIYLTGTGLLRVLAIFVAAVVFGSSVSRGVCYYMPLYLFQWLTLFMIPPRISDSSYRSFTALLMFSSCCLSLALGWFAFTTDPLNPNRRDGWVDFVLLSLPVS